MILIQKDFSQRVKVMVEKIRIVVNEDKCYLCGGCAGVCPTLAIEVSSSGWKFYQEKCISCRICVNACPVGALTAEALEGEE